MFLIYTSKYHHDLFIGFLMLKLSSAYRMGLPLLNAFLKKVSQQQLQITDFFVEAVANISLIKTYNAEARIIDELHKDNVAYRDIQITLASIRSTMFPFIATIGSIGQIILLYQGGKQIMSGNITIGAFVAFSSYLVLLAWPTAAISWIMNIIQRGLASLKRIENILDTPSHPQYYLKDTLDLTAPPKIEFKNVSFKYSNAEQPSLIDISFTIDPGKTLGIFGPTGSGKSTLANLISLSEPLAKGQILFDDQDINLINVRSLRDGIAMVPQRRFLFQSP